MVIWRGLLYSPDSTSKYPEPPSFKYSKSTPSIQSPSSIHSSLSRIQSIENVSPSVQSPPKHLRHISVFNETFSKYLKTFSMVLKTCFKCLDSSDLI